MTRQTWLAEKQAEAAALAAIATAEIVPSRRDFLQFVDTQKQSVALVPRLARANPDTGGAWPALDLLAFARACDEADTAALAVRTATLHGGTIDDLAAVAAAVTAPVLRDDLCVDRTQVYHARLHGADAVLVPAADLPDARLAELAATARSMHMATVLEVADAARVAAALAVPGACVGVACRGADGFADLAAAARLAGAVGKGRTVLLLSEVRALDDLAALRGLIDAAVVGDALLGAPDPAAAINAFTR
jgi:indole-3-glycerol phosphate synthase